MKTFLSQKNLHPLVGIVGRPNVGKSTLFNALVKKKKSIVRNEPGVTRDFLLDKAVWEDCVFYVMDTGGITEDKNSTFFSQIRDFLFSYIDQFDFLILVMDGRLGLFSEDKALLLEIQKRDIPFLVVVNKIDEEDENSPKLNEFYKLNVEHFVPASFEKKWGLDKVISWILQNFFSKTFEVRKEVLEEEKEKSSYKLVVVGQPNVGKSSFVNRILGFKRMLVSKEAGTTLDPVESLFSWKDFSFVLVDTAGLRRRKSAHKDLESLSAFFSKRSIEAADIVLLVMDMTQSISRQDLRIAKYALERNKPLILVANKIDEAKNLQKTKEDPGLRQSFRKEIKKEFHFFQNIPIVFTSAITGQGLKNFFGILEEVRRQMNFKISTSSLNRFFKETVSPVFSSQKKFFKFFYLTQTHQRPPSFMIFAKNAKFIPLNKKRFLIKKIQEKWNLAWVPIRLFFKEKT